MQRAFGTPGLQPIPPVQRVRVHSRVKPRKQVTAMSNVLKFPKAKVPRQALQVIAEQIRATLPKGAAVKTVLGWVWLIVRLPVFLLMYWLRLPIIFVCNLVSFPMLLCWLFSLYAFPDKHEMVWGFGVISFIAFALAWAYDFLLLAIAPQDMVRSL